MASEQSSDRFSLLRWASYGALIAGLVGGGWLILRTVLTDPIPAEAFPGPTFVSDGAASGVDHVYDGDFEFFVGGGVAVFDCDGDRFPDLYFAGGENPGALYRNRSAQGGALEFEAVDGGALSSTGVTGGYPIDIDGDGTLDLAVLRYGQNLLLRGVGDCRFEDAKGLWSFDGGNEWTIGFSAMWETESLPTLAFGNYLEIPDSQTQEDATCATNVLLRPDESNSSYREPAPLAPGYCALSVLFSDWNRSGSADLRVSNDRHYYRDGEEQLWEMSPEGAPRLFSNEDGWQHLELNGMGIASFDVTGDGLPEVFLTSQADNKLQTLSEGPARPEYEDIAIRRGATAHRPFVGPNVHPSTAWHPVFEDVNNDGYIDLYVSKGNVESQPGFAMEDPNNLMLGQADGTFVEHADSAGILNTARTRGAAVVDLNLDGMLDIVEVNRRVGVSVWRSVGWGDPAAAKPMGNWVAVAISQEGSNSGATGSWLELRIGDHRITREVTIGGGHAGGHVGWVHFGVGNADSADLSVTWPDGSTETFRVFANGYLLIRKGAGEAVEWTPSQGR